MSDQLVLVRQDRGMMQASGLELAGDVFSQVGRPDSLPEWELIDLVYFARWRCEMADFVSEGKADRKMAIIADVCVVLGKDGEVDASPRTIFCPAYAVTALRSLGLDLDKATGGESLPCALLFENKGTVSSRSSKKNDAHRISVLRTNDDAATLQKVFAAIQAKAVKVREENDQKAGVINGDDF